MILTESRHAHYRPMDLDDEVMAWYDYLDTCRSVSKFSYDELEEWAWARLTDRLGQISERAERMARERSTA